MLKPYHQREENINLLCIIPLRYDEEDIPSLEHEKERSGWSKIISDVQLNSKLSQIQRGQLKELLYEYSNFFSNIPGSTDLAEHDIELESERAIVAKPYRMSPRQIEILKSEVNKMLELKIIEPAESDFTSPLILVEAQGKEARPCIDYRRLNKVTRTQFFPLPNIKELLEKVSAVNISLSWILLEGIGVVLSQVCENEEHPIMFLSNKLSLAEQKYSTTEKECAAIIFAVQKLKCYLDGHQKFVIQTDHNPLVCPPRHSTGVPNDTVCMCVELVTNPSYLQILLSPDTGETKVSCPVQLVYLFRKNVQH
ncbi:retrovirus-related Pol polyprotein from transposon gypsy [Trichonephila clavipes]|nr:retrovirus-related Pol polyprotein from transposon gypsy [Trichonephila clavipes]